MSRKNKKSKKGNNTEQVLLPQNIISIGERVVENKNVYINQIIYREIHRFTKDKITDERGGILVGDVIEEFGKVNIIITGFIEAKYSQSTPTTLKFTHETWEYCHTQIDKKHRGKKLLGWIHTHPDFGIFLSEYDRFIQSNFFSEDWQIAYVIDPVQGDEGFYFWINGNLEKCQGFYIFDKTGVKIHVEAAVDTQSLTKYDRTDGSTSYWIQNTAIIILSTLVIIMFLFINNMRKQINILNQNINIMERQIMFLSQTTADSHNSNAPENTEGESETAEITEDTRDNSKDINPADKTNP